MKRRFFLCRLPRKTKQICLRSPKYSVLAGTPPVLEIESVLDLRACRSDLLSLRGEEWYSWFPVVLQLCFLVFRHQHCTKKKNLLYSVVQSAVLVGEDQTEWFDLSTGVRQGCVMSPILFSLFINGLAKKINEVGKGVEVGGRQVRLLMYADDIVLWSQLTAHSGGSG